MDFFAEVFCFFQVKGIMKMQVTIKWNQALLAGFEIGVPVIVEGI